MIGKTTIFVVVNVVLCKNKQMYKTRWEGNNPAYSNGSSDNLVKYWQARNATVYQKMVIGYIL